MNSRRKGKVGELEWARFLREEGFVAARRGVQFQGGPDSPDVVGVQGVHFEVKRCEILRLYDAMKQAVTEAKPSETPVVVHRRNEEGWLVILRAEDFVRLLRVLRNTGGT